MSHAIDLLKQDHRSVEKLFDRFEKTGDAELALRICQELRIHADLEEQLVYPLLQQGLDTDLAGQSRDDHRKMKHLVQRIERWRVADGSLRYLVTELKEVVLEHVEEEEGDVFPRIERENPGQLDRLGRELACRRPVSVSALEADISKLKGGVNRLSRQQRQALVEDLEAITKAQLQAYAAEAGVADIDENRQTKDEMVQAIKQALKG